MNRRKGLTGKLPDAPTPTFDIKYDWYGAYYTHAGSIVPAPVHLRFTTHVTCDDVQVVERFGQAMSRHIQRSRYLHVGSRNWHIASFRQETAGQLIVDVMSRRGSHVAATLKVTGEIEIVDAVAAKPEEQPVEFKKVSK